MGGPWLRGTNKHENPASIDIFMFTVSGLVITHTCMLPKLGVITWCYCYKKECINIK